MTPAVCAPFLFPFVDLVVDLVPVLQKALKAVQKYGLVLASLSKLCLVNAHFSRGKGMVAASLPSAPVAVLNLGTRR